MRISPASSRIHPKALRIAAAAVIAGAAFVASPSQSHAAGASCSAPMAAARLQSKTPFHATYVVTPTTSGTFPTEHHEEVWVGNTMYTLLKDKRWMHVPVKSDPMGGFTGPIDGFSQCQSLPSASIRGETAAGYSFKMESGRHAKMWISPKSGLPIRDVIDQDILLATLDFYYTNVHAPASP